MMRRYGLIVLVAALTLFGAARDALDDWIDATEIPPLAVATSVEMLGSDGSLLRAFTVDDGRWRLAVSKDAVDADFIAMLIAYEDKRFYGHNGVDGLALLRAGWQAATRGRVVSGGSTLTMQVARLLEDSGTGRMAGKMRQMRLAMALERRLTKDQILTLYLHLAPYGGNVEGVRAASLAWFGKEPARLTPAQAALLVALPQAPESRRPDRDPAAAREARDRIVARLEDAGALDADRAAAAVAEPIPTTRRPVPALAPHLTERLRAENPLKTRHHLTIDPALQSKLQVLAARAVAAQGERLSIAILVADHQTGAILASVGSADYAADAREGFVDMTLALRSPGSTLKPFVYGLAFDEGLAHPETLIEDKPIRFGTYAPQNFDRVFRGTVRVREALQLSLNIPVVTLTEALGPARLVAALRRTGAEPDLPGDLQPGLAVALGGVGISLHDLVQAYAALARGGVPRPLHLDADADAAPDGQRLFAPEAAWMVGDILKGIAPPGGAPEGHVAWKTGTSYGHRDAWALGYDGQHVAGVWMGRPDGSPVPGAFGGDLAAPVLFQVFSRIKPKLTPLPPPPPATLLVANADLPQPLRRFRPRGQAGQTVGGPELAFPPDGAVIDVDGTGLLVKVREGTPPFTWLADGAPVAIAERGRELILPLAGPGFLRLSVIDAEGRSAAVAVRLE